VDRIPHHHARFPDRNHRRGHGELVCVLDRWRWSGNRRHHRWLGHVHDGHGQSQNLIRRVAESAPRGTVLVVEDEPAIADVVSLYLRRDGFEVTHVTDGAAGLAEARRSSPVAIVLDVGLPSLDGTEICRQLRAEGDWTPVLFCTARDDEIDRVLGLELGGDDYITKPFSPRELVARVKAAVRRAAGPTGPITMGRVRIDAAARRVWTDDREVDLTATEFDLLAYLVARPGRVIERAELLAEIWGYPESVGTRTVDVHVAQLRSKLGEASPLRTVRGVGYSAQTPDSDSAGNDDG